MVATTYNNLTISNAAGSTTSGSVSVNTALTVNEALTIGASSTLTIVANASVTVAASKTLTVDAAGTIQNNSTTAFVLNGTLSINGTYVHNANSSTIPGVSPASGATYGAGSTLNVGGGGSNVTSTIPTLPASAYNVIWNCPNQSTTASFLSLTPVTINNFTVISTGTGGISNGNGGISRMFNIAGDLTVSGGSYRVTGNSASATANQITNVSGNVVISSGSMFISNNTLGSGTANLNVGGNISFLEARLVTRQFHIRYFNLQW